jgi:ketosteroid isomerase-like protein
MTIDDVPSNTAVVRALFAAMSAGQFAEARNLVDPDGTWWTLGRRAARPSAVVLAVIEQLCATSTDGFGFDVRTTTAEDDRVAAEVSGHATLSDGGAYDNLYAFLFRLRSGRVIEVWEYYDTAMSLRSFSRPIDGR